MYFFLGLFILNEYTREKVGQPATNISPFPLFILKYEFCSNTASLVFQGRQDPKMI